MKQPGCFGIPSVFSFKSPVCGQCEHATGCQVTCYQKLKAVQHKLSVAQLLEEHERHMRGQKSVAVSRSGAVKYELTEVQEALLATLPMKVAKHVRALLVRGWDVRAQVAAEKGHNPFPRAYGTNSLSVAFEMLLGGIFTKSALKTRLVSELGWTESTAASEVSMLWHVLPALGVARAEGKRMIPGPKVLCKNVENNQQAGQK